MWVEWVDCAKARRDRGVGQAVWTLIDSAGGQGSGIRPEARFGVVGSQTILCGHVVRL